VVAFEIHEKRRRETDYRKTIAVSSALTGVALLLMACGASGASGGGAAVRYCGNLKARVSQNDFLSLALDLRV
jgi:nitrate reductase alpha subunit